MKSRYSVTVEENNLNDDYRATTIYTQSFDELDLPGLVTSLNKTKPTNDINFQINHLDKPKRKYTKRAKKGATYES